MMYDTYGRRTFQKHSMLMQYFNLVLEFLLSFHERFQKCFWKTCLFGRGFWMSQYLGLFLSHGVFTR